MLLTEKEERKGEMKGRRGSHDPGFSPSLRVTGVMRLATAPSGTLPLPFFFSKNESPICPYQIKENICKTCQTIEESNSIHASPRIHLYWCGVYFVKLDI